jgi:hypothetical protein
MKYLVTVILIIAVVFVILDILQIDKGIKFRYNPTLSEEYIISQEKNLVNKILKHIKQ